MGWIANTEGVREALLGVLGCEGVRWGDCLQLTCWVGGKGGRRVNHIVVMLLGEDLYGRVLGLHLGSRWMRPS